MVIEHFSIVRFKFKGRNETIRTGLTLEEAKAWCSREDTHKEGKWFDGFTKE